VDFEGKRIVTGVIETSVPAQSVLSAALSNADFYDAYEAPLSDPSLTPAEIFLRAARGTPSWVTAAMALRNALARLVGLKSVGDMVAGARKDVANYTVGSNMGIFQVLGNSERELLLGIDDSHLDVRVSVMKAERAGRHQFVVSTVVRVHNWLGHLYMIPVGRFHPLVVRSMMRRLNV
jgi:uncharacterized protein DUF2867